MPFDVFLCHNSGDKPAVRQVAEALKARRLAVWLDEWELIPGRPWQEALESALQSTVTAAVLIGRDGRGPWQDLEIRGILSEFVSRDAPVIPVLLPNTPAVPALPLFLTQFSWVDLRAGITSEGIDRLQWGITGVRPMPSAADAEPTDHEASPQSEVPIMSEADRNEAIMQALLKRRKQLLGK